MTKLSERQHAIIDEASSWVSRLDNKPLTKKEQKDLADWLLLSAEHVQEFLFAAAMLQAMGDIETQERIPIDVLLAERAPGVIPLFEENHGQTLPAEEQKQPPANTYYNWKKLALIAATITLFLVSATSYYSYNNPSSVPTIAYNTAIGEQRSISLSDGSVVHLNTSSEIHVQYTDNERVITLLNGEALFKVAHNPEKPFRVYAGTAIAEAIGTMFNVHRQINKTNVAVVEGKVAVSSGITERKTKQQNVDNASQTILSPQLLTSEQEITINTQGTISPVHIKKTELITSWRDRQLIFENENLATIVAEFNRYNKTKIIVGDHTLASIRFDGVFNADDPKAFINFLKLTSNIEALQISDNEIRLQKTAISSSNSSDI